MVQNFMIIKIKRGNVIIVTHLNENYLILLYYKYSGKIALNLKIFVKTFGYFRKMYYICI